MSELTLHPFASYWDKGVANVPDMTGAKHLLDGRDFPVVFQSLGLQWPFSGRVCDIGCGTGRLAQFCQRYHGFDISPSMVEYCRQRGVDATLIAGPRIYAKPFLGDGLAYDLVTCLSVFTHVGQDERRQYLTTFSMLADEVLVDIIPGDGSGNVAVWTAVPSQFEDDCRAAGFEIVAQADHQWDMHTHRYYRLRRSR
jgi:SAM-dependent methyltransferase